MRWFRPAAIAAVFLVWCAATSHAGTVTQINSGTAHLFQSDVRPISTPAPSTVENGTGNPALVNPVLLVLGVPNTTSFAAPVLSGGAGTQSAGSVPQGAGLSNSGAVYSFLGLTTGSNSGSLGTVDSTANGPSNTGVAAFVNELTGPGTTGAPITATFNGAIPVGTFAVAYGGDGTGGKISPLSGEGGNAPFDAQTPEPASLLMLGTGLAALYARHRRRA